MSVASKTKTKMFVTAFLGLMAVSSVLPTWANTMPGTPPITTVNSIVTSTPSNQDLSELRTRLRERFSWVATEVRSLINGSTSVGNDSPVLAARTIDVSQWIWVQASVSRQDFFVDIGNDPYVSYITRLAAYDVLTPAQNFYPQNYFRGDDFSSLLMKLYQKAIGQPLNAQDIAWIVSTDGIVTKGMVQQLMYSLKNIEKIDVDGNPYDKLIRSEWAYYLVRMFNLPVLAVDEKSTAPLGDMFTDIANHPFAYDINTLGSLGILNTTSSKFYPDNYLRHYDFTILFVNALLASKGWSLNSLSNNSQFADVEASASYLPQLEYATDHGYLDYITMSKGGQLYFQPNSFITRHEVYQILTKALNIQFVYDKEQADHQKMSRGELARLLVESFQFVPQAHPVTTSWFPLSSTWDLSVLTKLKTLLSML